MKVNSISNQNFKGRCVINNTAIISVFTLKDFIPKKNLRIFFDEMNGLAKYIKKNSSFFDSYELGYSVPLKHDNSTDYFYNIYLRRKKNRVATVGPIPLMPTTKDKSFDFDNASEILKKELQKLKSAFIKANNIKG